MKKRAYLYVLILVVVSSACEERTLVVEEPTPLQANIDYVFTLASATDIRQYITINNSAPEMTWVLEMELLEAHGKAQMGFTTDADSTIIPFFYMEKGIECLPNVNDGVCSTDNGITLALNNYPFIKGHTYKFNLWKVTEQGQFWWVVWLKDITEHGDFTGNLDVGGVKIGKIRILDSSRIKQAYNIIRYKEGALVGRTNTPKTSMFFTIPTIDNNATPPKALKLYETTSSGQLSFREVSTNDSLSGVEVSTGE